MLNVHNLTVSFAGSNLFSGITFKLNKGESVTFKHRILVASKELSNTTLNNRFTDFTSN